MKNDYMGTCVKARKVKKGSLLLFCIVLSARVRDCRKQNEDFLRLVYVFKKNMGTWLLYKSGQSQVPCMDKFVSNSETALSSVDHDQKGECPEVSHPHQKFICYRPWDRKTVQAFTYCLGITMGDLF
jgi:hypothetical protein